MLKDLEGLEKRVESPGFKAKASAEVVAETEALLAEKRDQLSGVRKSLAELDAP